MTPEGAIFLLVIVLLLVGAGTLGLPGALRRLVQRAGQRWDARPNPHRDYHTEEEKQQ
ncbi:MAG TPA: hypothetical protein VKZ89_20145 [Thermobifida alba]|nr:hypothetical protein [Thermobifida alba]